MLISHVIVLNGQACAAFVGDVEQVAAFLTLLPQSLARAAVEMRNAGLDGQTKRFVIHPGEHQNLVRRRVLGDGGNEPVGIEGDGGEKRLARNRFVAQARTPVKGAEPNMPSLTEPSMLSPSTVPVNFRVIGMGLVIEALQAISVESADQRVQILITLVPPNEAQTRDAAWLEATFRKIFAGFVSGSVEGKITPFPLKLSDGIGVAAIFSDKDEAGKPLAKGRGHYKLVTNALVRVGDSTLATVSIFSDSKESPEYLSALKLVAGLRAGK